MSLLTSITSIFKSNSKIEKPYIAIRNGTLRLQLSTTKLKFIPYVFIDYEAMIIRYRICMFSLISISFRYTVCQAYLDEHKHRIPSSSKASILDLPRWSRGLARWFSVRYFANQRSRYTFNLLWPCFSLYYQTFIKMKTWYHFTKNVGYCTV